MFRKVVLIGWSFAIFSFTCALQEDKNKIDKVIKQETHQDNCNVIAHNISDIIPAQCLAPFQSAPPELISDDLPRQDSIQVPIFGNNSPLALLEKFFIPNKKT